MKKLLSAILFLFSTLFATSLYCCTSAIFSGKCTKDGRVLMWKHRDTGELNNRIEYFKGERYNFLALVDSPSAGGEAWSGTNSAGFSIMNTASYNLKDDNVPSSKMDKEGVLMFEALGECKTLKDFEEFLDRYKRPMGVEANFGVIDAFGGAAYYEVNNHNWKKLDVNDPKIAPQGYLIYTNHSFTGEMDKGMGYIRYGNARHIVEQRLAKGESITPEWIFSNLSRSFYHSLLGIDLIKDKYYSKGNGFFIDQDFIPRKITSASIVFAGVKSGENPLNTIMWTVLGYPPLSVALPLFVKAGVGQPHFMVKGEEGNNARMCDMVLKVKERVFPVKRGNGEKYFNISLLYNSSGNGYMQIIQNLENKIFEDSSLFIEKNRDREYDKAEFDSFYNSLFKEIERVYDNL